MNKSFITTDKTGVIIPAEGNAPLLFMEFCGVQIKSAHKKPSIDKAEADFTHKSFRLLGSLTGSSECDSPAFLIRFDGCYTAASREQLCLNLCIYINNNL